MQQQAPDTIWYVIVRKDNGYPLLIYADKKLAEEVVRVNNEGLVVAVRKIG